MGVRTLDPPRLPKHVPAKNPPFFTLPNRDRPKTCPVLGLNLWRETFQGVGNTPLHVYVQNPPGFIFPHPDAPQNAHHFTLPNKDSPKTHPVLDPNRRREIFRGVCNTPLHGYVQNLAGFIFPHPDTPKTHPVSPFPIRIYPKPARF